MVLVPFPSGLHPHVGLAQPEDRLQKHPRNSSLLTDMFCALLAAKGTANKGGGSPFAERKPGRDT